MHNRTKLKIFLKITAIIGLIQSFAFLLLGVFCLVLYYNQADYIGEHQSDNYTLWLSYVLYSTYLGEDSTANYLLPPTKFIYVCFASVVLNGLWFIFSLCALVVGQTKKDILNGLTMGFINLAVSIFDATIFILTLLQFLHYDPFEELELKHAAGIVMTIAAKGFVLWVINVMAGCYLLSICYMVCKSPPIFKFEPSIPRPKIDSNFYEVIDIKNTKDFERAPENETPAAAANHAIRNSVRNYKGFGNQRF